MEYSFGVESPVYVAIRAALSICSVGLLGALALRFVVLVRYMGPDANALRSAVDTRLPRWIDALGLAVVLATFARLGAQHAAVFGTDVPLSGDSLATLLFRAGWGRMWWLSLSSALAVTWLAPRLRSRSIVTWTPLAVAVVVLAASQPLSGHPAAAVHPLAAIAVQLLHVVGAGGWVGSLTLLTFVAIPAARRLDEAAADARIAALVRAFSPTALVFAGILGMTGLIAAWRNLGGIAPLWESLYGRTLLLKLFLLLIVAGTGAYNWRKVLPELGAPQASARLRRSSLIELGTAWLVLVVSAVLVATPMPGE